MDLNLSKKMNLSKRSVNIQVEKSVWTTLKKLKNSNETFNDVILGLLNQRSKELSNSKMGAIEYSRKTDLMSVGSKLGITYEYNDVKSLSSFTLDIKFKKIYFENKSYNPGEFFGVESKFFYVSDIYLSLYLGVLYKILFKEFGVSFNSNSKLVSLLFWRNLYSDYGLSEDSFRDDVEFPLGESTNQSLIKKFKKDIANSPSSKVNL